MAAPPTTPTGSALPSFASARRRSAARARRVDRLAHLGFAAAALLAFVIVTAIAIFVIREGWPSFAANGLNWFTDSPSVPPDTQLTEAFRSGDDYLRAWPFVLATLLTAVGAMVIALPFWSSAPSSSPSSRRAGCSRCWSR